MRRRQQASSIAAWPKRKRGRLGERPREIQIMTTGTFTVA